MTIALILIGLETAVIAAMAIIWVLHRRASVETKETLRDFLPNGLRNTPRDRDRHYFRDHHGVSQP